MNIRYISSKVILLLATLFNCSSFRLRMYTKIKETKKKKQRKTNVKEANVNHLIYD